MDAARLSLTACTLRDCKGPGVDVSGGASAAVTGGTIEQCVGGVWLWDAGRATLQAASVAGGPSHAILADGTASLEVRVRLWVAAWLAGWRGGMQLVPHRQAAGIIILLVLGNQLCHTTRLCDSSLPTPLMFIAGEHCAGHSARQRRRLGRHLAPLQPPAGPGAAHRLPA